MSGVNLAKYGTLVTYELLATAGMTTANTTTVTGGSYGSSPTATYTGSFVGTLDSASAATAQTQLTAFVGDINSYRSGLPPSATGTTVSANTTYLPGINYSSGSSITYSGNPTITFDAGGNPSAQFFITAADSITFTSVTIALANNACAGNIFFLANSAAITATLINGGPFSGNMIAGTSITSAATETFNGRMYARNGSISFTGTTDANAIVCPAAVICYAKGTKIMTPDGYRLIEKLKVDDPVTVVGRIQGDRYSLDKAETTPILWISNFTLTRPYRQGQPVCFRKGSLGENSPSEDLYVSGGHNMLIDGKAVPAWELINGTTIVRDEACTEVTYYHFETKEHSAVVANGALSETFAGGLHNENRGVFKQATMLLPSFNSTRLTRPFLAAGWTR